MYQSVIETIAESAAAKSSLFTRSFTGYLIHSAMAGAYVGLGIVLIFVLGAPLHATQSPFIPLVMGACFGIALSLVILAGSDLFTGNTMVLPIGAWTGKIQWQTVLKLFVFNYLGNFLGSIVLAWMVSEAGIFSSESSAQFLSVVASKKMGAGFWKLFLRGILCNWLVVLAVWSCYRLKTESGKLIMIFWCLLGFIGSGYEHSVANMTLLTLANFAVPGETVTWAGVARNLIPVTLGNFVSGFLFMGEAYWWISRPEKLS
ncbi:MAG: formate/nitrite transporter family protein [Bdellovibrionales bacterium]|nr:formate/nitrite transporter family protein [Bdellovibrionales bacterium]